ncbi:methionine/alanine import family NSS transporter small subunit [Streptomyces ferrugineus]|uniref:Methionine/alanine import family NSS transporter small subunit n=1 Tax=Streptomyces ferrugineus TaxID=1413221 RepID=A0A7M2SS82_9ACTN|nr:methionine/alanine import family NSS transporter small subunit [Streptomyces ferrugineus]QOV38839.1 methionine/alanine import family NSS transporter small subunit [Streptomyces ferrugineus]
MSGGAIIMMIIAMLIVWGGLVLAIIQLRRHPDPGPEPDEMGIPTAE